MADSESALCKKLLDCSLTAAWKDLEVNKKFMSKTNGVSITDFTYCGCVPNPEEEEEETSEHAYWHHMSSVHALAAPERESHCLCTTKLMHNYVVFLPSTKQVVVVGSDCIKRWNNGKLPKSCQKCGATYSGSLKFCKRCAQHKRDIIKAVKDQVEWQDDWDMEFGKYHGKKWSTVANEESYVKWCLKLENPKGQMVKFQEYLRMRRDLNEYEDEGMSYKAKKL